MNNDNVNDVSNKTFIFVVELFPISEPIVYLSRCTLAYTVGSTPVQCVCLCFLIVFEPLDFG